jgi:hypothetical protein
MGTAIAVWILQPPSGPRRIILAVVNIVMSPFYGCAVAAVCVSLFRIVKEMEPFATQPGHWLLLMIGTAFLGIGLPVRGSEPISMAFPAPEAVFVVLLGAGVALVAISLGVIAFAIGANGDETPCWRLTFGMIAWTLGLGILGSLLFSSGGIELLLIFVPPLVLAATFVAAVVSDLWQRIYRDFWHWLGIASFAGLPLHILLVAVADPIRM